MRPQPEDAAPGQAHVDAYPVARVRCQPRAAEIDLGPQDRDRRSAHDAIRGERAYVAGPIATGDGDPGRLLLERLYGAV